MAILVIRLGFFLIFWALTIFSLSSFINLAGLPAYGLVGGAIGMVVFIFALIWIGVGLGPWHLRSWAWWLAVIVTTLSIVGFLTSPATFFIPVIILVCLILV